jgi:hypothetical protein
MSREGKSPWVILNAHYLIKLGTFVRASTLPCQAPIDADRPDRAAFETGPLAQGLWGTIDCGGGLIRWKDFGEARAVEQIVDEVHVVSPVPLVRELNAQAGTDTTNLESAYVPIKNKIGAFKYC